MSERTWYVDPNRVADNSTAAKMVSWAAWYPTAFITGLIGGASGAGLWSCYYSSDGTTPGTGTAGDGVNRWGGGTFTSTLVVFGTGDHSWFVATHATLGIYLIIDCNIVSTSAQITIAVSKTAPTGGTKSARPTATDEWTYATQQITEAASTNAHKYSGILSTTGDFWILGTKTTSGLFSFIGGITLLSDTRSGDSCKFVSYYSYNASGVVTQASGDLYNGTLSTACAIRGRNNINTLVANPMAMPPSYSSPSSNSFMNAVTLVNANDATWDTLPIYIVNGTLNASQAAVRGRFADVLWVPTTLTDGSCAPSVAPFTSTMVGVWAVPWPSSTAPLL